MDIEGLAIYPGDFVRRIEFSPALTEEQGADMVNQINAQVSLSRATFELKSVSGGCAVLVIRGIRLRGEQLAPLLDEFLLKARPIAAAYQTVLNQQP